MTLTQADFSAVLGALGTNSRQVVPLTELAFGATDALARAGKSGIAAAVWLATLTQESDSFRTTTEYSGGTRDYAPYYGRTFQQITWSTNYSEFGAWAATNRPALLSEMQWAWLGGVWFFAANGLWPYADRGDFQQVENAVNRGALTTNGYPAGWAARLACYQAWTARVAPPADVVVTGVMDGPTVRRLQQWVGVGMDGAIGAVTYAAVQKWLGLTVDGNLSAADVEVLQTKIGAYVDGFWGPGTTRDLQGWLNSR
jgi:hypothetical protein